MRRPLPPARPMSIEHHSAILRKELPSFFIFMSLPAVSRLSKAYNYFFGPNPYEQKIIKEQHRISRFILNANTSVAECRSLLQGYQAQNHSSQKVLQYLKKIFAFRKALETPKIQFLQAVQSQNTAKALQLLQTADFKISPTDEPEEPDCRRTVQPIVRLLGNPENFLFLSQELGSKKKALSFLETIVAREVDQDLGKNKGPHPSKTGTKLSKAFIQHHGVETPDDTFKKLLTQ